MPNTIIINDQRGVMFDTIKIGVETFEVVAAIIKGLEQARFVECPHCEVWRSIHEVDKITKICIDEDDCNHAR